MAIDTAQAIIESRAPQYIGDARLTDFIALATQLTAECYGDQLPYAIALRALHMLAMADRGSSVTGAAGTIASEKEGQLARSYGGSSSKSIDENKYPDLSQTSWGRELIALQNMSFILYRDRTIDGC